MKSETVALICHNHQSFKRIVEKYFVEKGFKVRLGGTVASVESDTGRKLYVKYIRTEIDIRGVNFDRVAIQSDTIINDDIKYLLEVIAARQGVSYTELMKSIKRVAHPDSPDYVRQEIQKRLRKLKIFEEIGT